jgi:hypothetical protein
MSDKTQTEFSDEAIRRFLLGKLSESERPAFEQCLFLDDRLAARIRLAEFELADDFAFKKMGLADQQLFNRRFLTSAERRQQVMVSQALHDHFASGIKPVQSFGESLRLMLFGERRLWKYAFAGAVLFLLLGTAWLVTRKEPHIKRTIVKITEKRAAPLTSPVFSNHPGNNSSPDHRVVPAPPPDHNQGNGPVTVTLMPEATGDDLATVTPSLSGDQDIVRLNLKLKQVESKVFRAELFTLAGEPVFTAQDLKPAELDQTILSLDVQGGLLTPGDYQLKLSSLSDPANTISTYYFRVP